MSHTETHIGKMKRVKCDSIEQKAGELMAFEGDRPEYFQTNKQWLLCEKENFVVIEDTLWEIIEDKELEGDDEINIMQENEDGTVSFVTRFYNGGTCLQEMLQEGFEKLNT